MSMANQNFDFDPSIAALKQQWRLHLKKIREQLSLTRRNEASLKAFHELNKKCWQARFVLSFTSFGSEINLWPFNEELARTGQLVLPIVKEKELRLFQVSHWDQLEPHHWGMLEPKISECDPIDPSLIEISLIPGLGFDLNTKYRIGYGKGYYDQLLASNSSMEAWGIGFIEQSVENLPYSKEDIPLNQIYLF